MTTFATSREIPASPEQVFAAFTDPVRLARWWGPAGFTNTFTLCEFKPGGRWVYTMHAPNGGKHPNESVFAEIVPASRVVVQHISSPRYRLTIGLVASATGTTVSWEQVFEDSAFAERVRHIVVPANEQNLDRLTAEVLRPPGA
ncbi:MAG: SRPBCC domain-containing protein [Opitutae bacterium]|nr:SRPBCC domain-containing protein [Opitutae bacterium]